MRISRLLKNNSMKTLRLVLAVLLLILIATKESSSDDWDPISFDPRVDDWYAVTAWELEECSKWGGTKEAQSGATSSSPVYLSQTTLSLQGRKQTYDIDGFNKTLYTASWYLEPTTAMGYRVELVNNDGSISFKIDDGTASYSSPAVGYHSEYYDIEYSAIKMTYGTEWIKVPIIELQ